MKNNYLKLSDFSAETYRKNRDLIDFSKEALINHFLMYGIQEGRVYNHIINRRSFLDVIVQTGNILEIGPLDRPQLNSTLATYHSVDVFTKEQLQAFYKDDPDVNVSAIIQPTYIIINNDYSVINKKFKCIFSSHNIEHVPCLVTFLQNLQGLLDEGGRIYLIIPDKRYCFDYYKKETDIYDVLQLYYEKNSRPRFGEVLKMRTQNTHNNSIEHWQDIHGENNYRANLIAHYNNILNEYKKGEYMDSHVSFFTPDSFLNIMEIILEMQLINLEPVKLYHTIRGSNEFYAILEKKNSGQNIV